MEENEKLGKLECVYIEGYEEGWKNGFNRGVKEMSEEETGFANKIKPSMLRPCGNTERQYKNRRVKA